MTKYADEFRQILNTQVRVLNAIPDHDRLLSDGAKVAELLAPLTARFLTSFDLSSAPISVRPQLQRASEKLAFVGLLTHCLLFGSDYRLKGDRQIDFDALFSEWIVKSLTATSMLRSYNKDNQNVPIAVFDAVFSSDVEPLQKAMGLGWWRRSSNRNKFFNLFASGVLLGMLYDMKSKAVRNMTPGPGQAASSSNRAHRIQQDCHSAFDAARRRIHDFVTARHDRGLSFWLADFPQAIFDRVFSVDADGNSYVPVLVNAEVEGGALCAVITQAYSLWVLQQFLANDPTFHAAMGFDMAQVEDVVSEALPASVLEHLQSYRRRFDLEKLQVDPRDWPIVWLWDVTDALIQSRATLQQAMGAFDSDVLRRSAYVVEMMAFTVALKERAMELHVPRASEDGVRNTIPKPRLPDVQSKPVPLSSDPAREIYCWSCKYPLPVPPGNRGRKVRCPKCGTKQALPL